MQNTAIIYNTNKLPHVKALPVLGGCLLLSAAVCVAQVLGNSVILLLCLLGYLVFTAWACNKGIVFPVLLYFLPWSPLLKMYNGGISFLRLRFYYAAWFPFCRTKCLCGFTRLSLLRSLWH